MPSPENEQSCQDVQKQDVDKRRRFIEFAVRGMGVKATVDVAPEIQAQVQQAIDEGRRLIITVDWHVDHIDDMLVALMVLIYFPYLFPYFTFVAASDVWNVNFAMRKLGRKIAGSITPFDRDSDHLRTEIQKLENVLMSEGKQAMAVFRQPGRKADPNTLPALLAYDTNALLLLLNNVNEKPTLGKVESRWSGKLEGFILLWQILMAVIRRLCGKWREVSLSAQETLDVQLLEIEGEDDEKKMQRKKSKAFHELFTAAYNNTRVTQSITGDNNAEMGATPLYHGNINANKIKMP